MLNTTIDLPLENSYLSTASFDMNACLRDPLARSMLSKVVASGLLRNDKLLAHKFISSFEEIVKKELNDEQGLKLLRDTLNSVGIQERVQSSYGADEAQRVQKRVQQIVEEIQGSCTSLIDVGCGNGKVTSGVAALLGLDSREVFGSDVFDRREADNEYTYLVQGPHQIPLSSDKVDTALALMLLHHEADPAALMTEIHRVLKQGGILLVRDHDAATLSQVRFCRALDKLYYAVFNNLEGVPMPANYRSAEYWVSMIEKLGFKLQSLRHPEPDNPNNPFHARFIKVD